ncbi:DUF2946 domain-containing protein [Ideonella sp.]|uniref:DUF2946 domain-containing protein n=1 Tax=Ideonella sp. TaxID=1929293 RepID=UPI0035B4096A
MVLHARLRRHAWIAFLAIVALACGPTVSRALAAQQLLHQASAAPPAWAQICLHGAVVTAASLAVDGPEAPPAEAAPALDHCGLCALAGDLAGPPAPAVGTVPAPAWRERPPRFLQAPHHLHAWAPAQARAPPVLIG